MSYSLNQLKDIIANIDADIYIVRGDYKAVEAMLEAFGYLIPIDKIKATVDALNASDLYFIRLAKDLTSK